MVRKYGVGPKLKRAVMQARGWKSARVGTADHDDWYANWPTFSVELEAAVREAGR